MSEGAGLTGVEIGAGAAEGLAGGGKCVGRSGSNSGAAARALTGGSRTGIALAAELRSSTRLPAVEAVVATLVGVVGADALSVLPRSLAAVRDGGVWSACSQDASIASTVSKP
jgi:hypothetical protein